MDGLMDEMGVDGMDGWGSIDGWIDRCLIHNIENKDSKYINTAIFLMTACRCDN